MKDHNEKNTGIKKNDKRGFDWLLLLAIPVFLYFISLLVSQQVYLNQISREQDAADKRLQAATDVNEALRREREVGMTREGELPYNSAKKQ